MPKKRGRAARCVAVNIYPPSSRSQDGNWKRETDGSHIFLNALIYAASNGFLKRAKQTKGNKVPYAKYKDQPAAAAAADPDDEPPLDAGGMGLFD